MSESQLVTKIAERCGMPELFLPIPRTHAMEGVDAIGVEQTVDALVGREGTVVAIVQCLMFGGLGGDCGRTYAYKEVGRFS